MNRQWRKPTEAEAGKLIALAAVILGGFIYLYQPAIAGFPMNDGGLFYVMIRAIQADHFGLPEFVQYNGLNIPFAYPPLGFYVGALLSSWLHIDPLRILQWLPAIVLIGISASFYRLALRVLDAPIEAGIATFLYVCTPRSMTWLNMGGGLTRALGHFFLLLAIGSVYSLYTDRSRKHLIWSIVFATLATLSHPEASIQTAAACFLLFIIRGRSRRALLDSAIVGIGTIVLSAVWWAPALWRFGTGPFISAGQTGLQAPLLLLYPLFLSFSEEPMMTVIAVLGLVGLIVCIVQKEYFLPAWLFLPFLVEPRGAQTVSIVPLAMMGASALNTVIFPGLAHLKGRRLAQGFEEYGKSGAVRLLAGYIGAFLLIMAFYAGTERAQIKLSDSNMTAFRWIAANTPGDSRFLVMTGDNELFCDPVQEWFPVLTGRVSNTTIQGWEWISNGGFFSRENHLQELQKCFESDTPVDCLGAQTSALDLKFDYIYIARQGVKKQLCWPTGQENRGAAMILSLEGDVGYQRVYSTSGVVIFGRSP